MPAIGSQRRFFAEVRFGAERSAISVPGGRVVYDYWHLIEATFGSVLLPPQWQAADGRATWIWDQPSQKGRPTTAELARIRLLLMWAIVPEGDAFARAGAIAHSLAAKTDPELSAFVCATPSGLRIHSWGAATPAEPRSLDPPSQDILGQILVPGFAGPFNGEAILTDWSGQIIDRASADATGEFGFYGVSPGLYRVQARFSGIEVESGEMTVELTAQEPAKIVFQGKTRDSRPSAVGVGRADPAGVPRHFLRWGGAALAALVIAFLVIRELPDGPATRATPSDSSAETKQPARELSAGGLPKPSQHPGALKTDRERDARLARPAASRQSAGDSKRIHSRSASKPSNPADPNEPASAKAESVDSGRDSTNDVDPAAGGAPDERIPPIGVNGTAPSLGASWAHRTPGQESPSRSGTVRSSDDAATTDAAQRPSLASTPDLSSRNGEPNPSQNGSSAESRQSGSGPALTASAQTLARSKPGGAAQTSASEPIKLPTPNAIAGPAGANSGSTPGGAGLSGLPNPGTRRGTDGISPAAPVPSSRRAVHPAGPTGPPPLDRTLAGGTARNPAAPAQAQSKPSSPNVASSRRVVPSPNSAANPVGHPAKKPDRNSNTSAGLQAEARRVTPALAESASAQTMRGSSTGETDPRPDPLDPGAGAASSATTGATAPPLGPSKAIGAPPNPIRAASTIAFPSQASGQPAATESGTSSGTSTEASATDRIAPSSDRTAGPAQGATVGEFANLKPRAEGVPASAADVAATAELARDSQGARSDETMPAAGTPANRTDRAATDAQMAPAIAMAPPDNPPESTENSPVEADRRGPEAEVTPSMSAPAAPRSQDDQPSILPNRSSVESVPSVLAAAAEAGAGAATPLPGESRGITGAVAAPSPLAPAPDSRFTVGASRLNYRSFAGRSPFAGTPGARFVQGVPGDSYRPGNPAGGAPSANGFARISTCPDGTTTIVKTSAGSDWYWLRTRR